MYCAIDLLRMFESILGTASAPYLQTSPCVLWSIREFSPALITSCIVSRLSASCCARCCILWKKRHCGYLVYLIFWCWKKTGELGKRAEQTRSLQQNRC